MLKTLNIRDFALIEEACVDFQKGMTVITGETGAGKSLILDAISSLLGGKSSPMEIRTSAPRYVLEGVFDLSKNPAAVEWLKEKGFPFESKELTLHRECGRDGKSRILINQSLASSTTLRGLGELLAEVHNQNDQILLLDRGEQLDIIDLHAGLIPLRNEVKECFLTYRSLKKRLEELRKSEEEKSKRIEFLTFQIREIKEVDLKEGEEEGLIQEEHLLAHGELLAENYEILSSYLADNESAILPLFPKLLSAAEKIKSIQPDFSKTLDSLQEIYIQLKEINSSILDEKEEIFFSPDRLQFVQSRLDLISKMKKKYGSDLAEILDCKNKAEQELEAMEKNSKNKESMEVEIEKVASRLASLSIQLSKSRRESLIRFESSLKLELEQLGMPGAAVQVVLRWEPNPEGEVSASGKSYIVNESGLDQLEFYFSPNPGEKPRPLRKIASGGEVSRVMLAIRSILGRQSNLRVLIFDEIDSGLGGEIAMDVARKLKNLAENHQLILITHLQQIASAANDHLKITKSVEGGRTFSKAEFLSLEERTLELARMISGQRVSKGALEHAKELLKKQAV
ncbi:DNA repair protein RecN [Leptospira noguchii]|uniref:DNA repair protein RecN n=1 Tax=Leptospira noguchii TaxID=28182 RepID=A0A9Q8VVR0_9LEPT|nr:DNA repair protein RecN [Leptospira noguchii]EMI64302.1 DNA repair protein RecN [Leptospira noguchii str. Bonito]EMS84283.1 DNA repair protein RecN [Leptospira noguchii str. Cascata]TQE73090.1 DNA repair protein RecN [Leptospira noguchii]UOG29042.1 DNA repair protein RecN [Leptospira noguchii]UOG36466.1 DNA repair protein RecN [Leptospira noguchii]